MAFNTAPGRAEYTASAAQTVFTFTFKIFDTSDIKVYLTPVGQTPDDTADILIETTDYNITINGDNGGDVTLTSGATLNDSITLVRELPTTRTTEYQQSGDLTAEALNEDQDYQTYLILDGATARERALVIPDSVQSFDTEIPTPVANKLLVFNNTADGFNLLDTSSTGFFNDAFIVESVAAMTGVDPNLYGSVIARGYYAANDGGGGLFNYDATQSAVNNGGTIIDGWVRQYAGAVNARWFGANPSLSDNITEITNAITASEGNIVFDGGKYIVSDTVTFPTGEDTGFTASFIDAEISLSANNRAVIQFGTKTVGPLFSGYFKVNGLSVTQETGATGNIGVAIYNVLGSSFDILNVDEVDIGIDLVGANSRGCAYNRLYLGNIQAKTHGIKLSIETSGWPNQNQFFGGKLNAASGTTAIEIEGTENTFIGTAIEGTWVTGVKVIERGQTFINVRTEGTFSSKRWDLTNVPAGVFGNTFIGCYSPVDDFGKDAFSTAIIELQSSGTLKANTVQPDRTHVIARNAGGNTDSVLKIIDAYSSSGDSDVSSFVAGRTTGKYQKFISGILEAGGIDLGHNEGVWFRTNNANYNRGGLILGSYYLWMDSKIQLRIKNGVPASEFDGVEVATGQRQEGTIALADIADDININGKTRGKMVWSINVERPVYASGVNASDVWLYSDGTTAHTPV